MIDGLGFPLDEQAGMIQRKEKGAGIVLRDGDFGRAVSRLKQRVVEFTQEPKTEPWKNYAMFKDLGGNEFWPIPRWKPPGRVRRRAAG
jgi:hypothetical protein